MATIANGCNTLLNLAPAGTVPDVSDAMLDFYQPVTFTLVTKMTEAFQVVETGAPVTFRGLVQPLHPRRVELKPEGQRAWTWLMIHAEPVLKLDVDDVVIYLGVQTRIMARSDFTTYGYIYYEACQDYTGAGPA